MNVFQFISIIFTSLSAVIVELCGGAESYSRAFRRTGDFVDDTVANYQKQAQAEADKELAAMTADTSDNK